MYRNIKNTYENYTEKCSGDSDCYFDFSSLQCKTFYSGDSNTLFIGKHSMELIGIFKA